MRPLIKNPVMTATLIIISLAGFLMMLMLTSKRGVGLYYDPALYIYMARVFNDPGSFGNNNPYSFISQVYPPLFPLFLAAIHWLGGPDCVIGARWLNACLFGMNIFMVGLLIYRYTGAVWLTVAGSLWMMVKIDVVNIHSMALSEPLFIFWALLWALFFMDFLETHSQRSLWACSLVAVLACLTRLAGVTLVLTGVVMLIFDKKKAISNASTGAKIFAIGMAPLILLMMRICDGGHLLFRKFYFHPYSIANIQSWTWPVNPSRDGLILLSLTAVMICLGGMIYKRRDPVTIENTTQKMLLGNTAIIFIVIYVLSWLVTIIFFDAHARDSRLFLPVQIFGVLFCLSYVSMLFLVTKGSEFLKSCFAVFFFIYLIGMNLTSAGQWGLQRYSDGIKYDGKSWERSEIIREVKKIPPNTIIYTNEFGAIYLLAHRVAFELYLARDTHTLEHSSRYDDTVKKIREDLYNKRGLIVYFLEGQPELQKLNDLKKEVPLKMILKVSDGAIYAWEDKNETFN